MAEKAIHVESDFHRHFPATDIPAPADYPFETTPDNYSTEVFDPSYRSRRETYLAHVRRNPSPNNIKAAWHELGRLAAGGIPHMGILYAALDNIDEREDLSDCLILCVLNLLFKFKNHPSIPTEFIEKAHLAVLNFKYWPDEPGIDDMGTWTENHFIMFCTAGYLAGQLYPEDLFSNSGMYGNELRDRHRSRIMEWMNLRFFTGFSEWLSNVFYDEDLTALISLTEFSQDDDVRKRATMLVDLLLLDMALNHFQGVFGSSHGRSYANSKKWASQESTTDTYKLLFGKGIFACSDNMSAIALAISDSYQLPQVIYDIVNDQDRSEMLNRQRMGIQIDHANWWGLKFRNLDDGMHFLTMGAYFHPKTINLFFRMMNKYRWWENSYFADLKERKGMLSTLKRVGLLPVLATLFEEDLGRATRDEVNLYTYRTPDYMLSSAQDYRKGFGGDQQHVWQATLGPDAICFTTHPARTQGKPPNYWSGSGTMPRVAQIKNVVIAIYRITKNLAAYVPNELFYTHAWLPRDRFEEIIEEEGWIFARIGNGFLALLSQFPYEWQELPGEDQKREIIVQKAKNIWICEMGRKEVNGDFKTFRERILSAEVRFYDSRVSYMSPTQGQIQFAWKGPLRRDGRVVPLDHYPRYGNPYVQVDFPPEEFSINLGDHRLYLNWLTADRQASSFI
jgi:hypothetical protein